MEKRGRARLRDPVLERKRQDSVEKRVKSVILFMASPSIGVMMLLMFVLGIGGLLAVMVLNDILTYLDLQRRLKEEQRKREETESR